MTNFITPLTPLSVPGNSSRSFQTHLEAVTQPRGWLQFGWDPEDPHLRNTKYEAGLIQFDRAYCTTICGIDGSSSIPTLDYFFNAVLPVLDGPTRVTDVGCGQGEFVRALRDQGVEAVGFDPVLQEPCSYLFAELWSAKLGPDMRKYSQDICPIFPDSPLPQSLFDPSARTRCTGLSA